MSRLIDENEVKELLLGLDSLPWEEQVDEIVDAIPTAYSVEAVVGELEREIERDNEKERQYFIEGNERLGYCLNGKASALKLAIEIVKRGGRDDCNI